MRRVGTTGLMMAGVTVLSACGGSLAGAPVVATAPAVTSDEPPPVFSDAHRREKVLAALPAVEKEVADALAKGHIPGLAFGVVLDGEIVDAKGFGVRDVPTSAPVEPDTVFRIGSITKTFTATAILALRDAGKLSLDEPIERYLPEAARLVYPTSDSAKITLRLLLTHSSGLPRLGAYSYIDPVKPLDEATMLRSLDGFRLDTAPDTVSRYSNLGVALAGLLAARASGSSYRDLVTRTVLEPLGMTSTRWDRTAVPAAKLASGYSIEAGVPLEQKHWLLGASEAAGGLYSNLPDMARYAAFQLAAWPPRSGADTGPVRRASLREAHRMTRFDGMHAREKDGELKGSASGVGLTWQVLQTCDFDDVIWHNGGTEGYRSALYMIPDRAVAVIVLANAADADVDEIALSALRRLGKELAPRAAPRRPELVEALRKLGELYARWDDAAYATLFSPSFRAEIPAVKAREILSVLRDARGACTATTIEAVTGPDQAKATMTCERGAHELTIVVTHGAPVISGLRFKPPEPPSAPPPSAPPPSAQPAAAPPAAPDKKCR